MRLAIVFLASVFTSLTGAAAIPTPVEESAAVKTVGSVSDSSHNMTRLLPTDSESSFAIRPVLYLGIAQSHAIAELSKKSLVTLTR